MSRARNWCFTYFCDFPAAPDGGNCDIDLWGDSPWEHCRYAVWQPEVCPETGRTHVQGYAQFSALRRLSQLKPLLPTAHWEVARGKPSANHAYCTKEETRAIGYVPFEFGQLEEASEQGKCNELKQAIAFICSDPTASQATLLERFPVVWAKYPELLGRVRATQRSRPGLRECVVELVYGRAGCGKSSRVFREHPGAYWKPPGKWWPQYAGESVVVFDDLDGTWLTCSDLLRVLDRYPLQVEFKGGYVDISAAERIVITTNIPVEMWYAKHFETHPEHLAALKRRIHYVYTEDFSGNFIKQTGTEYFNPVPLGPFTGYGEFGQSLVDEPVV